MHLLLCLSQNRSNRKVIPNRISLRNQSRISTQRSSTQSNVPFNEFLLSTLPTSSILLTPFCHHSIYHRLVYAETFKTFILKTSTRTWLRARIRTRIRKHANLAVDRTTTGAISFHGTIDEKFIRGRRRINCAGETNTDNFSEIDARWKRGCTVLRLYVATY